MPRITRHRDDANYIAQRIPLLLPYLSEFWIDEAGIDASIWATALTAAGTVARDVTEAGIPKVLIDLPTAGGGDAGRLRSVQRYAVAPTLFSAASIPRRLVFEAEIKFGTVANLDNTTLLIGFGPGATDVRTTNDIAGFVLNADDLASLTDNTGTETINAIAGYTLTNWNKLAMEVVGNQIIFYVNGVIKQVHTTNLPTQTCYLHFYALNEATGASALHVGRTRVWYDDDPR